MSATLASIQWASQRPHRDYLPALRALTTALVFTLPKVDSANVGLLPTPMAPHRVCDRRVLWQLGISGDRPLVLVMAGSRQGLGLLRTMAQALREWAHGGVACDLLQINTAASKLNRHALDSESTEKRATLKIPSSFSQWRAENGGFLEVPDIGLKLAVRGLAAGRQSCSRSDASDRAQASNCSRLISLGQPFASHSSETLITFEERSS